MTGLLLRTVRCLTPPQGLWQKPSCPRPGLPSIRKPRRLPVLLRVFLQTRRFLRVSSLLFRRNLLRVSGVWFLVQMKNLLSSDRPFAFAAYFYDCFAKMSGDV